jgi:hypothetical protein
MVIALLESVQSRAFCPGLEVVEANVGELTAYRAVVPLAVEQVDVPVRFCYSLDVMRKVIGEY